MSERLACLRRTFGREPVPLVAAYVVSGLLAMFIPAIKHRRSIKAYQSSYWYQYQQNNGDGEEEEDGRREYDVNNCKWWQFRCTPLYMNENGEYVEQEQGEDGNYYTTPSWFSGWGGNQGSGDRASGDGNSANSGALKFVHVWQNLLFLGLLAYGALVLLKLPRDNMPQSRMAIQSLFLLIFLWMNTSFLAMWMLANGSIYTEGREIEEIGGFYNQYSVLVFLSNFWYMLWSACVCVGLGVRICRRPRAGDTTANGSSTANFTRLSSSNNNQPLPGDSMNYLPWGEPSVTVTGTSEAKLPNGAVLFPDVY